MTQDNVNVNVYIWWYGDCGCCIWDDNMKLTAQNSTDETEVKTLIMKAGGYTESDCYHLQKETTRNGIVKYDMFLETDESE